MSTSHPSHIHPSKSFVDGLLETARENNESEGVFLMPEDYAFAREVLHRELRGVSADTPDEE